jgi:AcrR family transcriptional regulator
MAEQAKGRQRRAAATYDQLLRAAREVFEAKGYQAATVGAITSSANTAHGTFYLYFRNKQEAFSRVMQQVCALMYEEATSPWGGDPLEALTSATRGFLDVFVEHRGLWKALLEGALGDEDIASMWLSLRRPFIDRIESNLVRMRDSGEIRPLDTKVAAHALSSMVEWFAFTHFVMGQPSELELSYDRVVAGLVDLWFAGVHAPALERIGTVDSRISVADAPARVSMRRPPPGA